MFHFSEYFKEEAPKMTQKEEVYVQHRKKKCMFDPTYLSITMPHKQAVD